MGTTRSLGARFMPVCQFVFNAIIYQTISLRTIFTNVPVFLEIFYWKDPKIRVIFIFHPEFLETFC